MVKQETSAHHTPTIHPIDAAQQAAEGRRAKRETLVMAARLWHGTEPDMTVGHRIFLNNVSLTGLAFRSRERFEKGDYYIRAGAGPLRLEGKIRVAWTKRRDDNTFEMGAAFVKEAE